MAFPGSSPPDAISESHAATGLVHDPTPGSVVAVCRCSCCEDARKGAVDTKLFIDLEMKLWRDRSDDRSSREWSWLNHDGNERNNWTALQWAAAGGHDGVVRFFLDAHPKANVMLSGEDGLTALHLAATGGHTGIALALLNGGAGACVNQKTGYDPGSYTALHLASREGHTQVVQVLLSNSPKADVNAKDRREGTPLHLASQNGHVDVVQVLLSNDPKADVNAKRNGGVTPLHLASQNGHVDVVQVLLSNEPKADVNAKRNYGSTPLCLASQNGHVDVVQVLLSNEPKADINAKDGWENTPLHSASKEGHVDVVQALSSNEPKADVNAKGNDGITPLCMVFEKRHVKVVQALLNAHSKPYLNVHSASGGSMIDFVDLMHEKYANDETQEIVNQIATIISKHIGEESYKSVAQMAYESSEGPIWQELIQKDPIKNYLEVLYRDRQAYVDAANAILVGAALIASVTFGSWLQPPLNYTIAGDVYTSSQSSRSMSPSSSYDPNYVDLEHNLPLRVFWVFNCLSFYFAIATVVFGACSVLPRKRLFIQQTVIKLRRNLLVTSIFLGFSVLFVTLAFGIAGCIVLAPIIKFQLYMIVPTCIRGLVCLFSLCVLFENIVKDLVRPGVQKNMTKWT